MPTGSRAEAPRLIAIAGPSCSGKTTLARTLLAHLPDASAFPLDAYYRDLAHLTPAQRDTFNFDAPDALDCERLTADLQLLARGTAVDVPVYDFTTHARLPQTQRVEPGQYLVVEGLFALYWPTVNDLYALKIFVTAPDGLCLQRRRARDIRERGRSSESIEAQYQSQVRPMYRRHIHPTAQRADIELDGRTDVEAQVRTILQQLP